MNFSVNHHFVYRKLSFLQPKVAAFFNWGSVMVNLHQEQVHQLQ